MFGLMNRCGTTMSVVAGLGLVLAGGSTASAASVVSETADPGVRQTTSGVASFTTTGADMAGMTVDAMFAASGGTQEIWAATGSSSGGVSGSGWSLNQSGNTFSSNWVLIADGLADPITSLLIDGGPGDTIFDVISAPETTPDSASGRPFTISSATGDWDLEITYIDEVAITGDSNSPYGDLFRRLKIDFVNGSFADGNRLDFQIDADTLAISGDIQPDPDPVVNVVPLPAAAPAGLALLGLVVVMRCRRYCRA